MDLRLLGLKVEATRRTMRFGELISTLF